MRPISKVDLARLLVESGWDRAEMASRGDSPVHRLLVREANAPAFESGPHRPIVIPGEDRILKVAVADRPILSNLIAALLREASAQSVIAAIPVGAYWLHNRSLADYLRRVPDAARVTTLLRRIGLTDRFQGGFLIRGGEMDSHIPILASQPFCGGPDVFFAARPAPLLITACHEFDVHIETPDHELAARLAEIARKQGLEVRGLDETD